jgi:hypothetical protein
MEILCKEVLQLFVLSTKAEKTSKGVSERRGMGVKMGISAKDIELQTRFEELVTVLAKLLNGGCLDAENIAEIKTRIPSCPSTAFLGRKMVANVAPLAPRPSPSTGECHIRDPSASLRPENYHEEGRQTSPPRY